jgi:16S rRNA (guanine(966)-N(2))-methyltransferase RsmD
LRIVAGSLRGRKLTCTVNPNLRPTPQMVREALFSILGNAVPERPFIDVFAGTGVVGLEAISRGASRVTFVERDFRLIDELERHLRDFGVAEQAIIARGDVYRWVERWQAPAEPLTAFLSPPFADFQRRPDDLFGLVGELQQKAEAGSVIVLQGEKGAPLDDLPARAEWEERSYGRNLLAIWVKETESAGAEANGEDGTV